MVKNLLSNNNSIRYSVLLPVYKTRIVRDIRMIKIE